MHHQGGEQPSSVPLAAITPTRGKDLSAWDTAVVCNRLSKGKKEQQEATNMGTLMYVAWVNFVHGDY
jgi:hypothetical protein